MTTKESDAIAKQMMEIANAASISDVTYCISQAKKIAKQFRRHAKDYAAHAPVADAWKKAAKMTNKLARQWEKEAGL